MTERFEQHHQPWTSEELQKLRPLAAKRMALKTTDLYAVYLGTQPSRRVAAQVEYLAEALRTEAAFLHPAVEI